MAGGDPAEQAEKALEVDFDDGARFRYPAELLRVESPSAEVMGHGPGQKTIVAGRRHVGILALEPVGNYAVRIKFDDLHDTGLYSWRYLYELGRDQEKISAKSEGAGREGPQPRSATAPLKHDSFRLKHILSF